MAAQKTTEVKGIQIGIDESAKIREWLKLNAVKQYELSGMIGIAARALRSAIAGETRINAESCRKLREIVSRVN